MLINYNNNCNKLLHISGPTRESPGTFVKCPGVGKECPGEITLIITLVANKITYIMKD
jgi:hypothetical protein